MRFIPKLKRLKVPTFTVRPLFKIKLGELIRITPGKRHAWYDSNVGPVRKPLQ